MSNNLKRTIRFSWLPLVALWGSAAIGSLEQEFEEPPHSAKPHVWWHWMNGNITKEGIQLDLEWMERVGLGGVQNFDASLFTPEVVEKPLIYMTPEWQDTFRFAVKTADQLNLDFAIAASPGWSETGGPWVKPKDGMKKLVWSEVEVHGGQEFDGLLPKPPRNTGPFMDFNLGGEGFLDAGARDLPQFYADVAVVAVPTESNNDLPQPRVESHSGTINGDELFDGSLQTSVRLDLGEEQSGWLQFEWQEPQLVSSVSLAAAAPDHFLGRNPVPVLEAKTEAGHFEQVAVLAISSTPHVTASFNPVTTSSFRIVFKPSEEEVHLMGAPAPGAISPIGIGERATELALLDVQFYSEPRVHYFEAKAGFAIAGDYYALEKNENVPGVPISKVVDLTEDFMADGRIDWNVPEGKWRILRIGYSLTGKENHPASLDATGLEVDKYDADAVKAYINEYLDMYVATVGADNIGKKGITALLNDSIEAGPSNWTPKLIEEFQVRRGYDIRPWLPALTGVIVENSKKTDAFLYDFRATLAEMLADNHYAVITEEVNKRGLTHYSEALEHGRPTLGDGMAMRRTADIPMAAMWTFPAEDIGPSPQYWSDMREAASVAHVYGKKLVAAESLTAMLSPWAFSPRDLQPMIDMQFALGVNRPIIHTSIHQPLTEKAPGFSLYMFGQYFNRLDTWAELAEPWVTYMSRNSYLLQQGRFVADVAYFYGQEAPLTKLYLDAPPTDIPTRHGFDYINADIILNELKSDGSEVVTEGGARYRVIYLGGTSSKMTLPVLKQLAQLVHNGAVVVGLKPEASPALQDDPEAFARIANDLWNGKTGKGKVVATADIEKALNQLGIAADFAHSYPSHDTTIMFVHRTLPDADIYYFTNRKNRPEQVQLQFRVTGKKPELWDAATGTASALGYQTDGQHTVIPLDLRAHESGFIVFREPTTKTEATVDEPVVQEVGQVAGEWAVEFQSGRGVAPGVHSLPAGDWTQSKVAGVPYFSGTAAYEKSIKIPARKDQSRLVLNLGEVGDLAEVFVNGESAGIAWKPPYRIDITELAKAGENQIRIEVTNLWVNRLIGDAQPDAEQITFTTVSTYEKDAPLRPSGLIGPVVLERVDEAK